MKQSIDIQTILLSLGVLTSSVFCLPVWAQIVPDGTLSTEVNSSDGLNFSIEQGDRVGDNLFHSFQEFSVPTGGSAFFNQSIDIENIFSRVTGNSISDIDGLLRANGTANLFLLNPNGIIFGPNARLEIGGSFFATTANSVVFENGLEFSATNPDSTPLLNVNVPLGVQFNENPGAIQATGSTLNVPEGEALALVGGSIDLNGVTMEAPGGRVELGGTSNTGIVSLQNRNLESRFQLVGLEFPVELDRSPISLTNGTEIEVASGGGGEIAIDASDLEVRDSFLRAGLAPGLGVLEVRGGNIELDATGQIEISNSQILSSIARGTIGSAGDVRITANTVEVLDGGILSSSIGGEGEGGTVRVEATETVVFSGTNFVGFPSSASSQVRPGGRGNGGSVSIVANAVEVRDGAQLDSSVFGEGNGGTVTVEARETAIFSGSNPINTNSPSGVFSIVEPQTHGNAGNVRIVANTVEVRDGAQLASSTFGEGNAGTVSVEATDTIVFFGINPTHGSPSGAFSTVEADGKGNAGGVRLVANTVEVRDGAQLSSGVAGEGNGGTVSIEATKIAIFSGTNSFNGNPGGATSQVDPTGKGNAGDVSVVADTVEVSDSAQLNSSTRGDGNPGTVRVVANTVEVRDGAQLSSTIFGEGDGGTVTVEATETVIFSGSDPVDGSASGAFSQVNSQG